MIPKHFFSCISLLSVKLPLQATLLTCASVVTLAGCSQGLDIGDEELVERVNECHMEQNKTPGMAVSCGNYLKECKRRGDKTGNYIC